jgi:hypothetical protein
MSERQDLCNERDEKRGTRKLKEGLRPRLWLQLEEHNNCCLWQEMDFSHFTAQALAPPCDVDRDAHSRGPCAAPPRSVLSSPPPHSHTMADGSAKQVAHAFNKILHQPSKRAQKDVEESVKKLRRLILIEGIPSTADGTLRHRIWKIFLRVTELPAETFLDYVARGPCDVREKIRNDTFRTLATDRGFKERVREDMLVRLLDAFVWRNHDRAELAGQHGFTYVQGMNVLAAPFLYTMPSELEAFFCFAKFIEEVCPTYVQPTLEGVHHGLKVRCLSWRRGRPL